ncbi:MAG: Asp-tRNA(Asn)/Glu-tRNA(Gln) amidotransferase subunit GatA [Candidatus Levybacteria bacterium]|nr:Asp-tRNA(Asn)/Glu-tRNA(Gln) amidotransferase subunit GatA [Candidatus Levybacteria bacterium]
MNIQNFTITDIIEGYKKKEFSVGEIVNSYLERIEKLNPTLNAFLTVDKQNALKKTEGFGSNLTIEQFKNFPLLGVPFGIKDMFLTRGVRTTAASNVLKDYIPPYSATAVDRLESAGAISLGKLNHDAWAHGSSGENSDFGNTLNPWNKDYIPGGSSSGSAVAVAASLSPFSTGTDTGGSIRLPASFTNTVGLKPTYGLVSRYGVISMASSLDSIGHFSKTVRDSAIILNATAGVDGYDATVTDRAKEDYTKDLEMGIKGLKVGVPKEYINEGLSPEVKQTFENSLKILGKLGAEIIDITLPHTDAGIAVYYIIQPSEVSSNLARYDGIRYGNDRSFFGKEAKRRIMLGTFTLSSGYYDAYYKKAMQVRTLIGNDFDSAFKNVDVIVSPVSPTPPWKFGEKANDPLAMYLSDALTVTINLAGVPGLAVPAGFSHDKLPIGIQFVGPHFSESLLFKVGHSFEQETKFYKELAHLE